MGFVMRKRLLAQAAERYRSIIDYPWADAPDFAVLRHESSRKWFGLIMTIPLSKLTGDDDRDVDVINLKVDPMIAGSLRMEPGIFPAWHMNKAQWISVLMDGTVKYEKIIDLIDMSYELTMPKRKRR